MPHPEQWSYAAPDSVRWGILGTARIARRLVPAMQASSNGQVVAIASRDVARARDFAREFNIPRAHAGYDTLLQDPDVDAVYIPLPNHLHNPWTIRALAAGKHVLCEKPLALSAAEAEEMAATAREHGRLLMEAMMYRFHPRIEKAVTLVRSGAIGVPRVVRSTFTFRFSDPRDYRFSPEMGGGALMDVGVYCITAARLMLDAEPVSAAARVVEDEVTGVDVTEAVLLDFPGERMATFVSSFALDSHASIEVLGTEGVLTLHEPWVPGERALPILVRRDGREERIPAPAADHYRLMVEHFGDAVLGRVPLSYLPEDAVATLRVVEMIGKAKGQG